MSDSNLQAEPPRPSKPRRTRRREEEEDDFEEPESTGVESLIPYKNPLGLSAYYCGVFSVIPIVGLLLGPAALILGLLGLRYSSKHPTAKGGGHAITGIVLGSLTALANWGCLLVFGGMALFG